MVEGSQGGTSHFLEPTHLHLLMFGEMLMEKRPSPPRPDKWSGSSDKDFNPEEKGDRGKGKKKGQ